MNKLPGFQYHFNAKSDTLDVILPGISVGIESSFIQKIIAVSQKKFHSTIAFNFPFFERGEKESSGEELKEEITTLKNILNFAHAERYKYINLYGKSLGAIVASYYLNQLDKRLHKKYSITVLGYVRESIDLSNFEGNIKIIQGQYDRYGSIKEIQEELKDYSATIKYFEIANADHSYRDQNTKEPKYEKEAIKALLV